jgi:hypothetical protein
MAQQNQFNTELDAASARALQLRNDYREAMTIFGDVGPANQPGPEDTVPTNQPGGGRGDFVL